jgi:hypothetical protein
VTITLGLLVLLAPSLAATPVSVLLVVTTPSLLLVVRILRSEASVAPQPVDLLVTTRAAAGFLLGACALGTNGEALLDMWINLKIRGSLAKGDPALAVANQAAILLSKSLALRNFRRLFYIEVLLSMSLALLSETSFLQGAPERKTTVYLSLWGGVQVLRVVGLSLGLLSGSGAAGALLVAAFVFVDKYSKYTMRTPGERRRGNGIPRHAG